MTCIVGMKRGSEVFIAGDSALYYEGTCDRLALKSPKTWRAGPWIFGACGSLRDLQLVQSKSRELQQCETIANVISVARRALSEGGSMETESGVERGSSFLAGKRDQLFCVASDWSYFEPANDRIAIGAGAPHAMGAMAMAACLHRNGLLDKSDLTSAIVVASQLNAAVMLPYTLVQTEKIGE